jgi:hypothetical protein
MPPISPTPAASAMDRAAEVLAAKFPAHIPGRQDGWLLLSRSSQPIAVWDLAEKIAADTPGQAARRLELAQALASAGFAVTVPGNAYMVFFAELPGDTTKPRYAVEEEDAVLASLFGGRFHVMDTWTGASTSSHSTRPEATERCDEITHEQDLADASARARRSGRAGLDATDNR